ncbi:MAG: sulfotransferase [Gammaproteobacteria bacterium]|nr:sulfotransferase [Xanthomonadales bacterium]
MKKHKIIFISGRFRSGTTMLWNIFNNLPQYMAWYEPLHTNLISQIEYVKPKEDHIGVYDYWKNYRHLENLKKYHSHKFGQDRLFMEKHENWTELEEYISYLIKNSEDKIPVLQFNRMDLRLSWLKNNFPNSIIINIQRHPYPQWISCRKHIKNEILKNKESYEDAYDLMQWAVDLSEKFPMLQKSGSRNGYFRHYFIWKLSQSVADSHADLKLKLEEDFFDSHNGIEKLSSLLNWESEDIQIAEKLIHKPESVQTKTEIPDSFIEIENKVDKMFNKLGLSKQFPSSNLESIKQDFSKEWSEYSFDSSICKNELLDAIKSMNDRLTEIQSNR